MRKVMIIGLLVVSLAFVSTSVFALDIPKAKIVKTGVVDGRVLVWVTGAPLTVQTAFYAPEATKNPQLAILLTAVSLEKTVWMRTMGGAGSLISIIYINQ